MARTSARSHREQHEESSVIPPPFDEGARVMRQHFRLRSRRRFRPVTAAAAVLLTAVVGMHPATAAGPRPTASTAAVPAASAADVNGFTAGNAAIGSVDL